MSNNLGLAIYTVGGDYDSWGDKIIADHGRIDRALGDVLTISDTSGTVTLTQDQSNYAVHKLTGALTGNLIVDVIAGVQRFWMVRNATSGAFSVTYRVAGGAGASVSITQGRSATVISDGVDCAVLDFSTLSGSIINNSIVKAKLEQLPSYRVLGNLSGSTANVAEVAVSNDTTLAGNSGTSLVTERAVKTYADALSFSATLPGITGIATQAEAEAGTVADKVMTPQRTKQAITALTPPAGQRTFTATGTLPNGATVVLNSDGTVSTVTSNNDTTGTATVFRSAATQAIASAALSATSVVVCYFDGTNSQAVIGTISGTSVSFGSAVTFRSGGNGSISVCALSSTSFAVAYRDTGNQGNARVGSVSGTTITFPSAEATFNAANTNFISIAALSSTAVVIAYQDTVNSSYGTAIIGTISGTTISFPGAEYVWDLGLPSANISVASLSPTAFVVSFNQTNTSIGKAVAGTVSGTTITLGTPVTFDSTNPANYTSIVALSATTFMVAWARSTTDGRAKIGTVSGTTVSFTGASDVVFNGAATYDISAAKYSANSVAIVYRDNGNSNYGTVQIVTFSDRNINTGSEIVFRSGSHQYDVCTVVGDKVFIAYQEGSNNYGTGVVFWPASTNVAKWIGITAASIANGASGLVTMKGGGIATNLSGLTTDTEYYLANDGTLTATQTSYKVGRAVSATTIPLTGNA